MSDTTDWQTFSVELAENAKRSLDAKDDEITTLRQQLAKSEARVAELEGSIKHAIGWIDGDLRELIRDMGNTVCTYNDLYDAADRIEAILAQSLRQQAGEAERAGGEK